MKSSGGSDGTSNGCVLTLDDVNKISYTGSGTSWYDNNGILTNEPISTGN